MIIRKQITDQNLVINTEIDFKTDLNWEENLMQFEEEILNEIINPIENYETIRYIHAPYSGITSNPNDLQTDIWFYFYFIGSGGTYTQDYQEVNISNQENEHLLPQSTKSFFRLEFFKTPNILDNNGNTIGYVAPNRTNRKLVFAKNLSLPNGEKVFDSILLGHLHIPIFTGSNYRNKENMYFFWFEDESVLSETNLSGSTTGNTFFMTAKFYDAENGNILDFTNDCYGTEHTVNESADMYYQVDIDKVNHSYLIYYYNGVVKTNRVGTTQIPIRFFEKGGGTCPQIPTPTPTLTPTPGLTPNATPTLTPTPSSGSGQYYLYNASQCNSQNITQFVSDNLLTINSVYYDGNLCYIITSFDSMTTTPPSVTLTLETDCNTSPCGQPPANYAYYELTSCNDSLVKKVGRSSVQNLTGTYIITNLNCYHITGDNAGTTYDYDLDTYNTATNCMDVQCHIPTYYTKWTDCDGNYWYYQGNYTGITTGISTEVTNNCLFFASYSTSITGTELTLHPTAGDCQCPGGGPNFSNTVRIYNNVTDLQCGNCNSYTEFNAVGNDPSFCACTGFTVTGLSDGNYILSSVGDGHYWSITVSNGTATTNGICNTIPSPSYYRYSFGYGINIALACSASRTTLYSLPSTGGVLGQNDFLYTTSTLNPSSEVATGVYSDGISGYTYTKGLGVQSWSSCNINCESWHIVNNDTEYSDTINYTDCNEQSQTLNLSVGGEVDICILAGTSISSGFSSYTFNGTYCS